MPEAFQGIGGEPPALLPGAADHGVGDVAGAGGGRGGEWAFKALPRSTAFARAAGHGSGGGGMNAKVKQIDGCLPRGFDMDSLLTIQQFATWRQVSVQWVRDRLCFLPGVFKESQKVTVIHPRTYVDVSLKLKKS